MRAVEAGWVYVIANPAMPNVCKIGMTTRTPEERAQELHDTGSPAPYHVVAKWPVADVRAAEQAAQAALARFRASDAREWFNVPVRAAVARVEAVLGVRRPRVRPWRVVRGVVEAVGWVGIAGTVLAMLLTY